MTELHATAASATGKLNQSQLQGYCRPSKTGHRTHATAQKGFVRARSSFVVVTLIASVLIMAGCSTPPTTAPTGSAGVATIVPVETTGPSPTTATSAVYKPATDQGPAENVPVPVLPDAAKEHSKAGLIAFTEHWYSALGYAFETGDTQPLSDITGNACEPCESIKKSVTSWNSKGRWISGGRMTVVRTETSFETLDDGTYQVLTMVQQTPVKYFNADKALVEDMGATPTIVDVFAAKYDSGRWTATNVVHRDGNP